MNTYLEESVARERLDQARAIAARRAMVRSLRPARPSLRVWTGLLLIRLGRSLAQRPPKRTAEPGRALA
jgi:hypothetical protein